MMMFTIIIISILLNELFIGITNKKDTILYKGLILVISLIISLIILNLLTSIGINIEYIKYLIIIVISILVTIGVSLIFKIDNDTNVLLIPLLTLIFSIEIISTTDYLLIIGNSLLLVVGFVLISLVLNNIKINLNDKKIPKGMYLYPLVVVILGIISILASRLI